jgi:hypothetical protein
LLAVVAGMPPTQSLATPTSSRNVAYSDRAFTDLGFRRSRPSKRVVASLQAFMNVDPTLPTLARAGVVSHSSFQNLTCKNRKVLQTVLLISRPR